MIKINSIEFLTEKGTRFLIRRWKPGKRRYIYQLFKWSNKDNDFIYCNKNFTSIDKVKKYIFNVYN